MLKSKRTTTRIQACAALAASLLLSACGGGGGGSAAQSNAFTGQAVKGVIGNGIVHAYQISADNENELLASTRTRADGSFSFDPSALEKAELNIVLVELRSDSDTVMTCDVLPGCTNPNTGDYTDFGDTMPVPKDFRLLGTLNPRNPKQAFLSPLSHLVLSTASTLDGGLSINNINTSIKWLKNDLGIKFDPLNVGTPDLTQSKSLQGSSDAELLKGIYSASLFDESMRADWASFNFTLENLDLTKLIETSAQQASALADVYSNDNPQLSKQLNAAADQSKQKLDEIKGVDLSIISQPQSVSAQTGDKIILRVSATGTASLSYQWYKNGSAIAGATSKQLSLNNARVEDSGLYYVDVKAGSRSEESLRALVTVQEPRDKPAITQQPEHQSLSTGQGLLLQVDAIGTNPLSYTWQKGGSIIPGANSATLNIPAVKPSHAGTYRVTVSNAYGTVSSQYAMVVVTDSVAAVAITSQPHDLHVLEGNTASLSVVAQGGGFISYQWRKDGNELGGQNSANLRLDNVSSRNTGRYDVVVSNSQGSVTSNSAQLNVVNQNIALSITKQPSSKTVEVGGDVEFAVEVSGTGQMSYQWYKDGQPIAQANKAQLVIRDSTLADLGEYRVTVSNGAQGVSSNTVSLSSPKPDTSLSSVNLTWDIPTAREDGSPLSMGEIKGYTLVYGYQANQLDQQRFIDGASTQRYTLNELPAGTLYLRIATVDSDNVTGSFSNTISVRLQP